MRRMNSIVTVKINGEGHDVRSDVSVVAVLVQLRHLPWRTSVSGEPRAPLCGMGVCFECRVRINGIAQRACQILVSDGMEIVTDV
jgi:sarcosine oxidase subunit alpha